MKDEMKCLMKDLDILAENLLKIKICTNYRL